MLADRYIYTAYARDMARGCDHEWVKNVYSYAVKPTISFYFQTPLDVSLERILSARPQLKYHEAGLDLDLAADPAESFRLFQGMIKRHYDEMIQDEHFHVVDATTSVEEQQQIVRGSVMEKLTEYAIPDLV